MKKLLLAVLAAYLAVVATMYLKQDGMVFPRRVNHITPPDAAAPANQEYLQLQTPDGATLSGLLFRQTQATASPTLILAFGGNAHDVTGFVHFLAHGVTSGTATVAGFSYRGYPNAMDGGKRPSTGTPTEANVKADAVQIYDALTARFPNHKVEVVGYSLGSAVATYLAAQRKVDNLVLVTPPASLRRIAVARYGRYLPVNWLITNPFDTDRIIGTLSMPVTALYTLTDEIIPADHIDVLKAANPAIQWVEIPNTTHGTILDSPLAPQALRNALAR